MWRAANPCSSPAGLTTTSCSTGPSTISWHNPTGLARNLTVHARDWLEDQPIGKTAAHLWNHGYAFDYVSDRQILSAETKSGQVKVAGGAYRAIVVPPAQHIPLSTLRKLLALAESGASVIFEEHLPKDVPGWAQLAERRKELRALRDGVKPRTAQELQRGKRGRGQVVVGSLEAGLARAGVTRELMFDQPGLMCLRRAFDGGWFYFIANRSEHGVDRWVTLSRSAKSVMTMDPLTGAFGVSRLSNGPTGGSQVYLCLAPGESIILRCQKDQRTAAPQWHTWVAAGPTVELSGTWEGEFLEGGPDLPEPFQMSRLSSWTTLADANTQRFAGTARYSLSFAKPGISEHWWLDLGKVCQSARVRLNGRELGTLFTPPFRVLVDSLQPRDNLLEVEVTSVAANRIRDLDRRRVNWKNFHDINFVGIDYKPFDASNWPLTDSGLLGPITLTPVKSARREYDANF